MAENEGDPLNVPMDQVITKGGVGAPKASEAKNDAGRTAAPGTPKIEGSHTQETVDPAERLPEEPEEQNDLA